MRCEVRALIIPGRILEGHDRKDPTVLADRLWSVHTDHGDFRVYADSMDEE